MPSSLKGGIFPFLTKNYKYGWMGNADEKALSLSIFLNKTILQSSVELPHRVGVKTCFTLISSMLSLSGGGRTILLGWPLFSSQGRRRRLQSGCGPSPLTGSIFPLPRQAQKAKPYMRKPENPGGQVGERGAVVRAGVA